MPAQPESESSSSGVQPAGQAGRPAARGIRAIVIAVSVWGGLLAIGATGILAGFFDLRRALIVAACFAAFLGFWGVMLSARSRRLREAGQARGTDSTPATQPASPTRPWSRAAITAAAFSLVAVVFWGAATAAGSTAPRTAVSLGWLSACCFVATGVATLVALSDPRPTRGRWLAVLAAIGILLGFTGWFL